MIFFFKDFLFALKIGFLLNILFCYFLNIFIDTSEAKKKTRKSKEAKHNIFALFSPQQAIIRKARPSAAGKKSSRPCVSILQDFMAHRGDSNQGQNIDFYMKICQIRFSHKITPRYVILQKKLGKF
jgi:hypothetical protein